MYKFTATVLTAPKRLPADRASSRDTPFLQSAHPEAHLDWHLLINSMHTQVSNNKLPTHFGHTIQKAMQDCWDDVIKKACILRPKISGSSDIGGPLTTDN